MSKALPSRLTIVYDARALGDLVHMDVGEADRAAVESVGAVIADVVAVARRWGARVRVVGLAPYGPRFLRQMAALDADLVVNFAESWAGRAELEAAVGWALEARGIAYTGAPPRALTLCLDKPTTRAVMAAEGVPTAEAVVWRTPSEAWPERVAPAGPWLVKPAAQDASHGIDAASVVADAVQAHVRARYLFDRGLGPVLVERYVDGRELNVSIVELDDSEPRILPIAEIVYGDMPAGCPRILTYAGKWDPASPEYQASVSTEAKDLSPSLRAHLERIAMAAWRALGLRGYARVDFRVDAEERPYVIDVNPNPDLSRDAGLALAAARAGLSYERLIEGLCAGALRGHQRRR